MNIMITKVNKVSLALLVAIGLQCFIVGAFTMRFMDISQFSIFNWILEIIYLTFSISFALRTDL
jgi:hypothetical protein